MAVCKTERERESERDKESANEIWLFRNRKWFDFLASGTDARASAGRLFKTTRWAALLARALS